MSLTTLTNKHSTFFILQAEPEMSKTQIEDRIHALASNVQREERHSRFRPGYDWWLLSECANAPYNAVSLWEQLGLSSASCFNVHFSTRSIIQHVNRSKHPFNFFEIRRHGDVYFITVKKQDAWAQYGTDAKSPTDVGAIIHREVDTKAVERLRRDIRVKGEACRAARAAEIDAPSIEARSIEAPSIEAPYIEAPSIEVPSIVAPSIEAPSIEALEARFIEAPSIEAPSIEAPSIKTSFIEARSIEARSIEARSITYQPTTSSIEIESPLVLSVSVSSSPVERQDTMAELLLRLASHDSVVPRTPLEAGNDTSVSSVMPGTTLLDVNNSTANSITPYALSSDLERQLMVPIGPVPCENRRTLLQRIADYVKSFRTEATKADVKCLKHVGHGIMFVLSKQAGPNGTVTLYPQTGGRGTEWVRVTHHTSAASARSARRYTADIRTYIAATNLDATPMVCEKIISKVCSAYGAQFSYRRNGRKLLVHASKDQLMLQMAGGMTDRQMIAFNQKLGELTGLSVHERKNSLASLVDDTMPDFSVNSLSVYIDGKRVERQAFLVERINDVVCSRIASLVDNQILVPSSVHTLLNDDTIILRFGGDKGGKFMQFKFGMTVMNCQDPNSPDSFDLIASLDAPDTYYNMKHAIFDKYATELEFYFDAKGIDPEVWLLLDDDEHCITSFVCEGASKIGFQDLWDKRVIRVSEKTDCRHSTGPFCITDKSSLIVLVGADQYAWGLRLVTTTTANSDIESIDVGTAFVRVDGEIPVAQLTKLTTKQYKLCSVLGGDIEFLNKVVGLQGCSATYPCYHCQIQLKTLRGRESVMACGPLRTRDKAKAQLDCVRQENNRKRQKIAARTNGSQVNPPLIPVNFDKILMAPLHIILGITKKIWDNLIIELQDLDHHQDSQRKKIIRIRDLLQESVKVLEQSEKANSIALEEAEQRKTILNDLLTACRNQNPVSVDEEVSLLGSLSDACKLVQECMEERKSKQQKQKYLSMKEVRDDLNEFLQKRRGKYERVVELILETEINCKHNPFYGGCFNGNDCMRLLQNSSLLFQALRHASIDETDKAAKEKLEDIAARHENIFTHFARIVPSFRSIRLLDEDAREELLEAIKQFWEAYIACSTGSVTIKMHFLVHHTELMLNLFGTIGFFAEDSMESIHAIVNRLAIRFAAIDKRGRCIQVLRVLAARKTQSTTAAVEKKEVHGVEGGRKRKRVQGKNKELMAATTAETTTISVHQQIEKAISHFMDSCSLYDACIDEGSESRSTDRTNSGTVVSDDCGRELTFPKIYILVSCDKCQAFRDTDTTVPDVLLPLHDILVHGDLGDKA